MRLGLTGDCNMFYYNKPKPKFSLFSVVIYNGVRTEVVSDVVCYGSNSNGVTCAWYYVPTLLNDFIYVELVPETDLQDLKK